MRCRLITFGNVRGNTTGLAAGSELLDYTSSVTTYDDGTNPAFRRQQIVGGARALAVRSR